MKEQKMREYYNTVWKMKEICILKNTNERNQLL